MCLPPASLTWTWKRSAGQQLALPEKRPGPQPPQGTAALWLALHRCHLQSMVWPFGWVAVHDSTASKLGVVGAVIWLLPGLVLFVSHVVSGVLLCLTVIGIPFGLQAFKLAGLSLAPFGKKIVPART